MKRALVTGGAGFIGSHLVDALVKEGIEVCIIDNLSVGKIENINRKANFIEGDILDSDKLKSAMSGCDVIFHLAAKVTIRGSVKNFVNDAMANHIGTLNVIEEAVNHPIKKFIFASSMAVYSDSPDTSPIDESHLKDPIAPYGISKLAAEQNCLLIGKQYNIPTIVLRFFNTYGTRQQFTPYVGVVTIFINRLLNNLPPIIFGDGQQTRDFVCVSDIVKANMLAMKSDVSNEVFNIGSGVGRSVEQVADFLCKRYRPDVKPIYEKVHGGELYYSVANCQKAKQILNYLPEDRFEELIDEIYTDLKKLHENA